VVSNKSNKPGLMDSSTHRLMEKMHAAEQRIRALGWLAGTHCSTVGAGTLLMSKFSVLTHKLLCMLTSHLLRKQSRQ
jgi:hypothetical protein